MKNITLTANTTGREIIVNWNSVEFAKETQNAHGENYVELHFNNKYLEIKETLQEIHAKCLGAIVVEAPPSPSVMKSHI
tara:strand:+ start:2272 stop:2508 length:237 start_codon:yes stop_codon:yes gene_type:complete